MTVPGREVAGATSRIGVVDRLPEVSLPPFEVVVARHGPTVLRVCRAVVGALDAEDAWSETFLAALRAYPELPASANVEAWLVTIAHRKALDQFRARSRRAVPVADVPDTVVPPAEPDGALWAALALLTEAQRQTVAYHHLAGLPYREVAAILGNSEAAARRAAADGIAALRRTLRSDALSTPTGPTETLLDATLPTEVTR